MDEDNIINEVKSSEVQVILIDTKGDDLSVYDNIQHLLMPVITEPKKAIGTLSWLINEMIHRYTLFEERGVRDIARYNEVLAKEQIKEKVSYIVAIIYDLADLEIEAPDEVKDAICKLKQMGQVTGFHLVFPQSQSEVEQIITCLKDK